MKQILLMVIKLRMSAETIEFVTNLIGPKLKKMITCGVPMINAKLQIIVALYKLTTAETYQETSEVLHINKSTAYNSTRRVIQALCPLAPVFIRWPTPRRAGRIAKAFEELSGVPGVVGVIGDCELGSGRGYKEAMRIQIVCDDRKRILHCHTGASSKPNVFEESVISTYLGDKEKFPNDTHLIGNETYQLHENLLVPYEKSLTDQQRNFNQRLASVKIVNECLGSLTGRFGSLHRGLAVNSDVNKMHVTACCVLHNICMMKKDSFVGPKVEMNVVWKSVLGSEVAVKKRDGIARILANDIT